ncbi:MAG: CoA pyrophosphatase [Alphaproteobacteria bacterium]|nr:CoA pyrophosphatase [Alphaproteobacteria bacterium]
MGQTPVIRQGTQTRLRGDHDLNPGMDVRPPFKNAAVLVPVVDRPTGPTILLTQRTDNLPDHPGQISFPGGSIEARDADAAAAALRETDEEIGVPGERVELIGRLDDYAVRTGFLVSPFVGIVKPPLSLRPDPVEVAEVFEVPLEFVLDSANHTRAKRMFQGAERHFYVLPFERRYIWGATAGMLVNLYEVLVAPR